MILSILIPVINRHMASMSCLVRLLNEQIVKNEVSDKVEIVIQDGEAESTGVKRNALLSRAIGQYVAFIDADDLVADSYIEDVLNGCKTGADVISFNGWIETDGKNRLKWYISKDLPYKSDKDSSGKTIYLRYNNHLSPIKKEIALAIGFPDKTFQEDYDYATKLKESGLIKTEYKIDKELYFYKFSTVR